MMDSKDLIGALVVFGLICAAIGGYALPWLWSVIKPILHALTA